MFSDSDRSEGAGDGRREVRGGGGTNQGVSLQRYQGLLFAEKLVG